MGWRNCNASIVLAREIDADPRFKNRDHESDGTIGDAAHASRKSDHNPWVKDPDGTGVVRARDIDEDLDGNRADTGADAKVLFDFLLGKARSGDPRLNGGGYLIYEGHIYSEKQNWAARVYTGPNAHKHHIHVSFSLDRAGYDSTAPWGVSGVTTNPSGVGVWDSYKKVRFLQAMLNILRHAGGKVLIREDGVYGNQTKAAVAEFQRDHNRLMGHTVLRVSGAADAATCKAIGNWVRLVNK